MAGSGSAGTSTSTANADVTASVTFLQLWVVAAGPEPLPSTEQQTFRAVSHQFRRGYDGYLVLIHGDAHVATDEDPVEVDAGGAVEVYGEPQLNIRARTQGAEALLVEFRRSAAQGM